MKDRSKALLIGVGFALTLAFLTASRNSGGTYSLPSGNPVVPGTTITSAWANATLGDIGTELTNSLDRSGRGAMLAPLQLSSGSAPAPGLTWSSETTSGLYRAGAGDIRQVISGTTIEQWVATGVVMPVGLSVTQSQVNSTAISGYGNGTAAGVFGLGGGTSGTGGGFVGGAPGGSGVVGTGTSTGAGGLFTSGTGHGVIATGGAGAGANGVRGTGGSNNGTGVSGFGGGGNGLGVYAQGTGTAAALEVNAGHALFSGGNPASTTGFVNVLTPKNVPKAWIAVTGGASPTVNDGFNIASTSCGSNVITVNFASGMANANYAPICSVISDGTVGLICMGGTRATGSFKIACRLADTSIVNLCGGSFQVACTVFGAQ